MTNIEVISASAGSGKTHRLIEILAGAIAGGEVSADRVLVSTFTRKAANEIQERVRVELLRKGLTDAAHDISAARIGTVHAVCSGLIRDFAFDLGLSPGLRVLDAGSAARSFESALAQVVDDRQLSALASLEARMVGLDWRDDVRSLLEKARTNGIDVGRLREMGEQSWHGIRDLLEDAAPDGDALDDELTAAGETFLSQAERVDTKTTKNYLRKIRGIPRALREHRARWNEWVTLLHAETGVTKDARPYAVPMVEVASRVLTHPRLHDDMREIIELVFEIAAAALEAYGEHKRRQGVIDFADQEAYALQLLSDPALNSAVAERLAPRLDLLLVDEFQDTSPIQLAIFLKLAEHADRSVWVGDQKQSIYGFRGSDPALMDAVLDKLSPDPDVLQQSWRSVPSLIEVNNTIFAGVFPQQGIPTERVRLRPANETMLAPPGPVVERFILESKNVSQDADAVADCVDQVLRDESVYVRDPRTGALRRPFPADVAVLCRRNDHCVAVADALHRCGRQSVLSRPGLLQTPEGRLALAALRLFVDARDGVARAEVLRFVVFPDDPDGWLADQLVAEPVDREPLSTLIGLSGANPTAGPLEALDSCIDGLALPELCHRWGDTAARLANLSQLRAHALAFADSQRSQSRPVTVRGLVEYLQDLRAAGEAQLEASYIDKLIAGRRMIAAGWSGEGQLPTDTKARLPSIDAIQISTWHGAKGMEWPIVVLTELGEPMPVSAFGVHVTAEGELDLAAPLANRSVRYWPQPFDPKQRNHPLYDAVDVHPATIADQRDDDRQQVRLLYVAMTRARDRMALAARSGKLATGVLDLLRDAADQPVVTEFTTTLTMRDLALATDCRTGRPGRNVPAASIPSPTYRRRPLVEHSPAILTPSAMPAIDGVYLADAIEIGDRIPLSGTPDMTAVGQVVHGFLATDDPSLSRSDRVDLAMVLLERWQVSEHIFAHHIVQSADNFRAFVDTRWPGASWPREAALRHRRPDGRLVRGIVDLILETAKGIAIVDHKSFPGQLDGARDRVRAYGAQLCAYADAIGRQRVSAGLWIHLPVLGVVVEVRPHRLVLPAG